MPQKPAELYTGPRVTPPRGSDIKDYPAMSYTFHRMDGSSGEGHYGGECPARAAVQRVNTMMMAKEPFGASAPARIHGKHFALPIAILLFFPATLPATDLNQQTLNAWNEYIRETNSRMQEQVAGTANFLWMDEAPGRRERVRQGEILVEPANKDIPEKVPQGLIHDWIGAAFIPNATIASVFAMLDDYSRYDQIYRPAVIRAQALTASGPARRFSLLLAEKGPFVTAAIESEYTSQTVQLDQHRWYTVSHSTRIQQIDNYGQPGERELPPDQGAGYIWRLYSIQRFEERDGGVYMELEAIALSRNIPFELQWLVRPILRHLPRNSMIATLQKTRDAVCSAGNSTAAPEVAKIKRDSPSGGEGAAGALAKGFRGPELQRHPPATSLAIRGQN